MTDHRILEHPILACGRAGRRAVLVAGRGDCRRARAKRSPRPCFANGVRTFGHHHKDGAPQGIFCANGQCAQCSVVADGLPVKSCMASSARACSPAARRAARAARHRRAAAHARHRDGRHRVPHHRRRPCRPDCGDRVGQGGRPHAHRRRQAPPGRQTRPADAQVLRVDRGVPRRHARHRHRHEARAAGARHSRTSASGSTPRSSRSSPTAASACCATVSTSSSGRTSCSSPPAPARSRSCSLATRCPASTARARSRRWSTATWSAPPKRLFVIGGGNVGLIAGYHALQAGIDVVGLCEALPECGGYKVHKDKLVRMGVPVYTSHTIVRAEGPGRGRRGGHRRHRQAVEANPGNREAVRVRHGARRGRPRSRSTSSCTRRGSSACRRWRRATRRKSRRHRRRCSPAAFAASRLRGASAATWARCRRNGTAPRRC